MKKIAIFSDSHNNIKLLQKAVNNALKLGADYLVHLGDNYDDMSRLNIGNATVIKVPGLWCRQYKNPFIHNIITTKIEKVKFTVLHDLNKLNKTKNKSGIVLYGHTHHWDYQVVERVLYFNPGHLKNLEDRGMPATYGMINIDNDKINTSVYSVEGNKLFSEVKKI